MYVCIYILPVYMYVCSYINTLFYLKQIPGGLVRVPCAGSLVRTFSCLVRAACATCRILAKSGAPLTRNANLAVSFMRADLQDTKTHPLGLYLFSPQCDSGKPCNFRVHGPVCVWSWRSRCKMHKKLHGLPCENAQELFRFPCKSA